MLDAQPLRVVFFGTPQFAVPTLDRLLSSRHQVVAVVTQPDRPRGRGHKTIHAPVKARALDAGLSVLQPSTLKDPGFMAALAALESDIGIVAAYGKLLSEIVLVTPRLGMLNVHASLLPRYRGAAPVHRAVIAGERETGVTIMRVVKALDAGPILMWARRPILEDETSEDVEHDLSTLGADLLLSALEGWLEGSISETAQVESDATYAPRLSKEDGLIDWSLAADEVHNLVRGLHPWPHAYSFLNGHRIIVLRADTTAPSSDTAPHVPPGTLLATHGDDLRVQTGRGAVMINELQTEGKRPMTPREFLAGHHLLPGACFVSLSTSHGSG